MKRLWAAFQLPHPRVRSAPSWRCLVRLSPLRSLTVCRTIRRCARFTKAADAHRAVQFRPLGEGSGRALPGNSSPETSGSCFAELIAFRVVGRSQREQGAGGGVHSSAHSPSSRAAHRAIVANQGLLFSPGRRWSFLSMLGGVVDAQA